MTDMDKVGPVDHIARLPLPWRTEADYTECGKPLADYATDRLVTADEVQARIKRIGKQRAAFTVCMTCADTVFRWSGSGGRNVLGAIEREIQATQYASPPHPGESTRDRSRSERMWARRQRLEAEVEALAALVAAHREEFDGYLAGRADTVSLADRRQARRLRGAR